MKEDKGNAVTITVEPRGLSRLWKKPWTISFWPGSHTYRINNERTESVTGVTGMSFDKSHYLGPWNGKVAIEYLQSLPQKKLIKAIKEKPEQLFKKAKGRADEIRDKAGAFGKDVHRYIHHAIKYNRVRKEGLKKNVKQTAETFLNYLNMKDVTVMATEQIVGSKQHMYTGTLDLLIRQGRKLILPDIKTGKSIGPQAFMQVGGYVIAWEEMTGKRIDECWICHVKRPPENRVVRHIMSRLQILRAKNAFLRGLRNLRWYRKSDKEMRRSA